jgi:TolB-like protein
MCAEGSTGHVRSWQSFVFSPTPSIVVLPFANIGGDAEQDYFVEGVTDSLTTDVSRIPGALVIARNTASLLRTSQWTRGWWAANSVCAT